MILLTCLFSLVAFCYASIGFGGGSSYIALLVLFKTPPDQLPIIALVCNIVVVSGNILQSHKLKQAAMRTITPFLITSIPTAFWGGATLISPKAFLFILGLTLCGAGTLMLQNSPTLTKLKTPSKKKQWTISLLTGLVLGYVSGLTGIGGGIFLAPILYLLNWNKADQIKCCTSIFILINSLFGLWGQIQKEIDLVQLTIYWQLPIAVLIGGQISSWISRKHLSHKQIKTGTAVLIIVVGIRLLIQTLFN